MAIRGERLRTKMRSEGRGRLDSIDRLPPEADDLIAWAMEQVIKEQLTQLEIVARLNAGLAARNIRTVSRSSFNRWANDGLLNGFPPRGGFGGRLARCPHCGFDLLSGRQAPADRS